MTTFTTDAVQVRTEGAVPVTDADYARRRLVEALGVVRDPVLFARVRLTHLADPAVERPAVAQLNVDVNGRPVRAQVARPTMREAVDAAHDRLRERLQRAAGDWEAIRGGRPSDEPHEWRHTSRPADRPPWFPRPVDDRRVVRHKAFGLARMTVDEAAFDMEMLDYGFHLFTEDGSGVDSVLYRTVEPPAYRLAQTEPRPDRVTRGRLAVTVSPVPAPSLDTDQAVARLDATGWPFVFYRDARTDRGCVLYHRYDGHYGLVSPAD